jgi:hypothetical protein
MVNSIPSLYSALALTPIFLQKIMGFQSNSQTTNTTSEVEEPSKRHVIVYAVASPAIPGLSRLF